jgi:hypothetical protein
MWNRAALKMMRIAALLAVADNYIVPIVQLYHVEWALGLVMRDIAIMTRHLEEGNVGASDIARERKIIALCRDFYANAKLSLNYRVKKEVREEGLIPRRYLQLRTSNVAAFTAHRYGSTIAFNTAVKNLIDNGQLMQVNDAETMQRLGIRGTFYRLLDAIY